MCVSVILLILLVLWLRRRRKPDYLIGEPDQDVRENMGFYDEEGAGESSDQLCFVYVYVSTRLDWQPGALRSRSVCLSVCLSVCTNMMK